MMRWRDANATGMCRDDETGVTGVWWRDDNTGVIGVLRRDEDMQLRLVCDEEIMI